MVYGNHSEKGSRPTIQDHLALHVSWLHGNELTVSDQSEHAGPKAPRQIRVLVKDDVIAVELRQQRHDGSYYVQRQQIALTWTACHYGGKRLWFICPTRHCERRIGTLFLSDDNVFRCRHCLKLAYASQRQTIEDRAAHSANHIRRRLGWAPGILSPVGGKPKGMHQKTFNKLVAKHDDFAATVLCHISACRNELGNL